MLKGAIIGFGQVAEKAHAPAFKNHPDFTILAVAEENPQRAAAARAVFPGINVYPNAEKLLSDEPGLDFVDIATPPYLHARFVLRALAESRHVLCEKPLALNPRDFKKIQKLGALVDRTVFTVHNWKHAPLFAKLLALVSAGAVGAVDHVELHTLRSRPAAAALGDWRTDAKRAGGGIVVDHGWHSLYLLHQILGPGQALTRVTARLAPERKVEQDASVFLQFPSASALLRLSWLSCARANWGVVHGREGTLEIRDDHLTLSKNGKTETFQFPEKISQGSAHPEWFKALLTDFREEVQGGPARGKNLREARFCLDAITSIYK